MIQVIHRAFDILEILAKKPERPIALSEITEKLNLNAATCANILKTLVSRNYVEQVGHKKGYRLGAMAYYLSGNLFYNGDIVLNAKPFVEELTIALNESSVLATMKNEKRLVIYNVQADQDLQVKTSKEKHVFDSATGRVLLAYLEEKEIEVFILKYGLPKPEVWKNVETPEKFKKELKEIRAIGEAYQFSSSHICGIAVPVYKQEKVVASLGIFLPEIRLTKEWEREILKKLKSAAEKISAKLSELKTLAHA